MLHQRLLQILVHLDFLRFGGRSNLREVLLELAQRFFVEILGESATLGAAGAVLVDRNGAWLATPPPITPRSTVGAGDSFSGGFLAHWLRHAWGREDLSDVGKVTDAAQFGITVAGLTCQRAGADPPFTSEVS